MNEIVKIKDSTQDELLGVLRYVIKLIGVPPEKLIKDDLTIISDYLCRNFQQVRFDEIKIAFELGIKGELDIDMNHYQSFNSMYVSNVLLSHKRYKMKQNKINNLDVKDVKLLPYSTDLGATSYEFIKGVCESGKEPYIANWDYCFEYMIEKKIIVISDQEYQTFIYSVISKIKDEIKELDKLRRNTNSLKSTLSNKDTLKRECRKQYIIKHFEK